MPKKTKANLEFRLVKAEVKGIPEKGLRYGKERRCGLRAAACEGGGGAKVRAMGYGVFAEGSQKPSAAADELRLGGAAAQRKFSPALEFHDFLRGDDGFALVKQGWSRFRQV